MTKRNIKKQVKKLARQRRYQDIYIIYGQKWFKKYTPKKYQKQDKEKLIDEGRFLEIYNKYGEINENIQAMDMEYEMQKELSFMQTVKVFYKRFLKQGLMIEVIVNLIGLLGVGTIKGISTDNLITENGKRYEKEIENYQKENEAYAKSIQQKNYTDLEIFMKLMKDMYEQTRGYGPPEMDVQGYYGMDLKEGGIGVCRNMAENIADKLNEINPNYNARSIVVISNYSSIEYNNIEQKTVINDNMTLITRGSETRLYNKEGELVGTEIQENDKRFVQKYENGKIIETMIIYQKGDMEITDTYEGKQLICKTRSGEKEWSSEKYDQEGHIERKMIANKDHVLTYDYVDDNVVSENIQEEGKETNITYEDGKIVSVEEKELETYDNMYLTLQDLNNREEATSPNHAVVIIDVEKDNATIILDPTNATIGVFKDGKIKIFNETEEEEPIKRSFFGDVIFSGTENFIEFPKEFIESFLNPTVSMEELEQKYGVEAQNKALAKIEKQDKKETFKEGLKVDGQVTEDEIVYNMKEGKAKIFGEAYNLIKRENQKMEEK